MPTPNWTFILRTVVLTIVLAFASGALAAALTTDYLSGYALSITDLARPIELDESRPRSFPQSYAEAVEAVKERGAPTLATVLPADVLARNPQGVFPAQQELVYGAVLTSDGWIVSLTGELAYLGAADASGHRVAVQGQLYEIERVVMDPASEAVFVKIDARNLPVVEFGQGLTLQPGDQAFAVPYPSSLAATRVESVVPIEKTPMPASMPGRFVILEEDAASLDQGTPVFNVAGELVGLADGAIVLPMEYLTPALRSLLEHGEVRRPALGLSTLSLSDLLREGDGPELGALVPSAPSIERGGPAAAAGIEPGDVIFSVNGEPVNERNDLSLLLSRYAPDDTVTLRVIRGEEELDLQVTLGALE